MAFFLLFLVLAISAGGGVWAAWETVKLWRSRNWIVLPLYALTSIVLLALAAQTVFQMVR